MSLDKLCPECKTEINTYKLFFEYGECPKCGITMQEAETKIVPFDNIQINIK
ncbi:hypothetical protein UT300012_32920 [Paraclostridium bifermentans]